MDPEEIKIYKGKATRFRHPGNAKKSIIVIADDVPQLKEVHEFLFGVHEPGDEGEFHPENCHESLLLAGTTLKPPR